MSRELCNTFSFVLFILHMLVSYCHGDAVTKHPKTPGLTTISIYTQARRSGEIRQGEERLAWVARLQTVGWLSLAPQGGLGVGLFHMCSFWERAAWHRGRPKELQ